MLACDLLFLDDPRNSADNKQDVPDQTDNVGKLDGLVPSKVLIGQVGSEQGGQVDPKGVEGGQTEGGLLAHTESTGLAIVATGSGSGTWGEGSLDKVLRASGEKNAKRRMSEARVGRVRK